MRVRARATLGVGALGLRRSKLDAGMGRAMSKMPVRMMGKMTEMEMSLRRAGKVRGRSVQHDTTLWRRLRRTEHIEDAEIDDNFAVPHARRLRRARA